MKINHKCDIHELNSGQSLKCISMLFSYDKMIKLWLKLAKLFDTNNYKKGIWFATVLLK